MPEKEEKAEIDSAEKELSCEDQLASALREKEEFRSGWQRERADFQNFKKDIERMRGEVVKMAQDEVLEDVLKVVDYFDAAIAHVPEESIKSGWGQGLIHIQKELQNILNSNDVKIISCEGQMFDPSKHETIGEIPDSGKPHGTILEVVLKGYTRNNNVLRAALVKIAT